MTEEQRLDPRYDPAFQRGFEGTVTSGQHGRTTVRRTALVSPAPYLVTAEDPASGSAASETAADQPGAGRQTRHPADGDDLREVGPTRSAADEEPEPTPEFVSAAAYGRADTLRDLVRNPFLVGLVVLGLALVIGGAAWANQVRALVASRGGVSTELDYWFLEASVAAAPLTILAGIGILAGVLFVAAGVWNRRLTSQR